MKFVRHLAPLALASLLLASPHSVVAAEDASWNGTWTGSLGKHVAWPVSISIADGKVVDYRLRGVAFAVRFSEVTPSKISFGDHDNYLVTLVKTGDRAATGRSRGRKGEGPLVITKQ